MVPIQEFVSGLSAIPDKEFTHPNVLNFLFRNRVDIKSLDPYLYFSSEHYTRNLIHKTDLFELIAICWEIGQKSPIHNHRDQKCWMAVAYGKVQIHNFRLIKRDPVRSYCELESSIHFFLDPENPGQVDPAEPIHLVANPSSFHCRAVTLHIYSLPFDSCEVYDLKGRSYQDVKLVNTTEYGVPKNPQFPIEKVSL